MGIFIIFAALFALAVAWGLWRRFHAIQWIWLLFGTSAFLLLLWFVLVFFVIGPNMRRMMQFVQ